MQQTKKKMVLEHLVVHKMNTTADLKQVVATLGQSSHTCIPALVLNVVQRTCTWISHIACTWLASHSCMLMGSHAL